MLKYAFRFPNEDSAFTISDDIFGRVIDTIDTDIAERHKMKLIVSELFMNAYLHGNNRDNSKSIDVEMEIDSELFVVTVKDEGGGIAKERFKEMVASISAPEDESGRGITIVQRISDKIQLFKDSDDKFCIKATKKIKKQAKQPKKRKKKKSLEAV
ncbi:MAG: ATP-binding protein [candidate division Zixibacteria bacterium]